MDFRRDSELVTDEVDFMTKRPKLQQELENLAPIPDDDLERAVDPVEGLRGTLGS